MAEDPKISQRYRELSREEPSPQIDAAILAAARRAAETRPAPLVVPSGRRRWYFPLAAAAIIVLAVAVTVQVERQQPDPEIAVPPVTEPKGPTDDRTVPSERAAEESKPAPKPAPMFTPDPKPEARRELRAQRDEVQPQAAPAPPSDPAPEARAMAKLAVEPPERWLERIAELRKLGKHEEADKALAEFRRAYPDYRISEAMLEKVEKR
jgi:negative regulator of sigma E activity